MPLVRSLWVLLILLAIGCSDSHLKPIVRLDVVDGFKDGRVDRSWLRQKSSKIFSSLSGFSFRKAKKEEIAWQLNILVEPSLSQGHITSAKLPYIISARLFSLSPLSHPSGERTEFFVHLQASSHAKEDHVRYLKELEALLKQSVAFQHASEEELVKGLMNEQPHVRSWLLKLFLTGLLRLLVSRCRTLY